jgi:DNA-binding LacI/PurR family transcriptional regulator
MEMQTKAKKVESVLRSAIRKGEWKSGDRMPSEQDLVARLGVNRSTLRDALNALACDGLIVRKSGSGTYVNNAIKVNSIAIVGDAYGVVSPVGYWFRDLLDAAAGNVRDSGRKPIIALGQGDSPEQFVESLDSLFGPLKNELAGVLGLTTLRVHSDKFEEVGVPYVEIELGESTRNCSVVLDYARMVGEGVKLMKSHGHSDFTLMNTAPSNSLMSDNYRKWSEPLHRMAVDFNPNRLVGVPHSWDGRPAYDSFIEWWNGPHRTNALFITDDGIFEFASRAILELGIRVPEDLAILTHANVGRELVFPVPVTSLGWDSGEVVSLAWSILSDQISGREPAESVIYVAPVLQKGCTLR